MQCINVIFKFKKEKVDYCPIRSLSLSSFPTGFGIMGRPKINNKKETKSFRVDPRLWKLVQAEAKSSKSKPTDIINEALARHLGGIIRKKMDLDNEKLIHFLTRLDVVSEELDLMKGDLSKYESKNRKRT